MNEFLPELITDEALNKVFALPEDVTTSLEVFQYPKFLEKEVTVVFEQGALCDLPPQITYFLTFFLSSICLTKLHSSHANLPSTWSTKSTKLHPHPANQHELY